MATYEAAVNEWALDRLRRDRPSGVSHHVQSVTFQTFEGGSYGCDTCSSDSASITAEIVGLINGGERIRVEVEMMGDFAAVLAEILAAASRVDLMDSFHETLSQLP